MTRPKPSRRKGRRRTADAPDLLVSLDAKRDVPLHRQLYEGVREAILAGRLQPGDRLPSTRTLAGDLRVSRTTVTVAFDQLRTEGYLDGRRGGGTRVRRAIPDALLNVRAAKSRVATVARPAAQVATGPVRLSTRGSLLTRAGVIVGVSGRGPACRPFRLGLPSIEDFPADEWARLSARRWRRRAIALCDAEAGGEPELRVAIAEYLTRARGARCTAEQVVMVSGTQQALHLIAQLVLDPGDEVWLEDPGYVGARATFIAAGARVVPVAVDAEGMDVAEAERSAPNARLAYVTPSHQFPLGAVLSAPRRLALLAWAQRSDAWIVEDDYDSEFRYAGRPMPCMQGLEAERLAPGAPAHVVYVGTFSKTLVPALRLGYLVVPERLVDAVLAARSAIDRHLTTLGQGALADFIGEGHYARHLRRMRALYAERQEALVQASRDQLAGLLHLEPHAAGLHLVGWLADGMSDVAAAAAARAEGVEVIALSPSVAGAWPARPALLLGYAAFTDAEIRKGVNALGKALRRLATCN